MTTADPDFCNCCGWPHQSCVCDEIDNDDDYSVCVHGVGFDEDCEDCDAEDYEEHLARFGMLPP